MQSTVADPNSTVAQIERKIVAVRETRAKASESLQRSQKALTDILTVRQEAILMGMGIL